MVGELETRDPRAGTREARAQQYLDHDLQGQKDWYGKRASTCKQRTELLAFLIIAGGAATAFVQIFASAPWVPVVAAALGSMIALAEGWQRIARYGDTWMAYRIASERIKREQRLYVNGANGYRDKQMEEEAYLQFVEAVEGIVAEEQQIYWQHRGSPPEPKPLAEPTRNG